MNDTTTASDPNCGKKGRPRWACALLAALSLFLPACAGHRTSRTDAPAANGAPETGETALATAETARPSGMVSTKYPGLYITDYEYSPEEEKLLKGLMGNAKTMYETLMTLAERQVPIYKYLLEKTEDSNWMRRWNAVNIFGFLGDPEAVPVLVDRALRDTESHVRWRSLWAVRECDSEGENAMPMFREALETEEPGSRIHWNAAVGLSFFHDAAGLNHMHTRLATGSHFQRWEAVNALGRINDERSSAALREAFETEEDNGIRAEMVMVQGRICDDTSVEMLEEVLDARNREYRWRAALGLGRCGRLSSLTALRRRNAIEEHDLVKEHLAKAISKLEAGEKGDPDAEDMDELRGMLGEMQDSE